MDISRDSFDRLSNLWEEQQAFPIEKQTEANLHLMGTLANWVEADYAYWCGLSLGCEEIAEDDPLKGWRMRVSEPYIIPAVYSKNSEELLEDQHLAETIGMASIAIMHEAGTFRSRLLRELVDLSEYEQSEHFERFHMPYGLSDRLYVVTPIGEHAESCYCFELAGNGKRIPAEHAQSVSDALRGLGWFQRRLILRHGLTVGEEPLGPMEQSVLLGLLAGKSEKQIALSIDRAISTTHNYVTALYRRFKVSTRAQLMALWVQLGG